MGKKVEDSYIKNYNKKIKTNTPNPRAYELKGKKVKLGAISAIHQIINLEQLKKEYDEVAEKEKAAADAAVEQAKAEERAAAQKRDDEATTYINANR